MLDVRRLRLLVELRSRGTLAAVATALHQSPSSVSQQLSLLEREVGVELLRKHGRRVQLTSAAEVLAAHGEVILDRLDQAEADLAAVGEDVAGTVRVAVFQSAAVAFMPETLARLARLHPRLRVMMSQRVPEEAMRETVAREFDLVIAEEYPGHVAPWHADLDRMGVTTDALRLAVPPSGRPWDSVETIRDAAGLPWIMEPVGADSRHYAETLCREAGFEPDVRFVTDDLQSQIALIESGHALAILPALMTMRHEPAVRFVELAGSPRRTVFTATRTAIAASPAIRAFRETLATVVADVEVP